jgi:hypothetical protein
VTAIASTGTETGAGGMPALLEAEHAQCATSQVAVPCGRCAEPSNVAAGGGACPIRFRECTDRILITGRRHLHRTLSEYADRYAHRPHHARGQKPPGGRTHAAPAHDNTCVRRRDRLGGLLHEYSQAA